jgi:hypothetical protein
MVIEWLRPKTSRRDTAGGSDKVRVCAGRGYGYPRNQEGISMMHLAAKLQFERVVDEFARWRALPEEDRPPAPAWWWGPAIEVRSIPSQMPADWCARLDLPGGASYAAGAKILFRSLAGQTVQPWPYDFSSKVSSTDSDVRDLHAQPSDDSAFLA